MFKILIVVFGMLLVAACGGTAEPVSAAKCSSDSSTFVNGGFTDFCPGALAVVECDAPAVPVAPRGDCVMQVAYGKDDGTVWCCMPGAS